PRVVVFFQREANHDQVPAVVLIIDFMLAARAGGAGALSDCMAAFTAVPHCRHRGWRRARSGQRNYFPAGPAAARDLSPATGRAMQMQCAVEYMLFSCLSLFQPMNF